MTKYVIQAHTNGTKITLQAPGQTAERALWRVRRNRLCKNAAMFLVFERKTGGMVLAVHGDRRIPNM